jgi:hypothetical protein
MTVEGSACSSTRCTGIGEEDGQRVRGGPDWLRSERYTIEAVVGAGRRPIRRRCLDHCCGGCSSAGCS